MEKKRLILLAAALASLFGVVISDEECTPATKCDQAACEALGPENCHCSGNETSIPIADRPMVSCVISLCPFELSFDRLYT